jgi:flagellar biosynthetic protein FliP
MTTPRQLHAKPSWIRPLLRHYLEMVVVMIIGMAALGALESWLLAGAHSAVLERPDLEALVMATNMTVPMAAWMRLRGHAWPPVLEMSAAMYLPFVILFVPLWLGMISGSTLMTAGHVLMLVAMAAAMLLRRADYAAHHCA